MGYTAAGGLGEEFGIGRDRCRSLRLLRLPPNRIMELCFGLENRVW